ncbi:hypothetical protein SMUG_11160 [Gallibacterium anatis]
MAFDHFTMKISVTPKKLEDLLNPIGRIKHKNMLLHTKYDCNKERWNSNINQAIYINSATQHYI